jgi:hypothetical protein
MHSLTHSSAGATNSVPYIALLSHHVSSNMTLSFQPPTFLKHDTPLILCDTISHIMSSPCSPIDNRSSLFDIKKTLILLSTKAKDNISHAICNGWAKSTMKHYTGAIQQFIDFCIAEQIPDNL